MKGECYFGINDEIVMDCLDSLYSFEDHRPIVVGGLAIQIHGAEREKILRKTSDADLLGSNETFEDFREGTFMEIYPFLRKKGYCVNPKRGRGNNAAQMIKNMNKSNQESFLVHWTLFPRSGYDDFKDYIQKQKEFAKEIVYSKDRRPTLVASLEEILPLKIRRSITHGSKRADLVGPLYEILITNAKKSNWGTLANIPLTDLGSGLSSMQKRLKEDGPYIKERFSTYKLTKDIYDLCLSARLIADSSQDFDKDRYEENLNRIL